MTRPRSTTFPVLLILVGTLILSNIIGAEGWAEAVVILTLVAAGMLAYRLIQRQLRKRRQQPEG